MKSLINIFLTILISASLSAQNWRYPEDNLNKGISLNLPDLSDSWHGSDYIGFGLLVLGGIANGFSEAYEADPTIYEKHWGVSQDSWSGSKSWKRKYKDYDGGDLRPSYLFSKSYLVVFSDLDHFSEHFSKWLSLSGMTVIGLNGGKRKYKWYIHAGRFLTGAIAFSATSSITYNLIR